MTGLGAVVPLGLLACGALISWRWLGSGCATRTRRVLWSIALSPAIGFGVPALAVVACALLSRRLPGPAGLATLLIGLYSLLFWLAARFENRPPAQVPAPPGSESRIVVAAVLVILAFAAGRSLPTLVAGAVAQPTGSWDAVAIWNARASLFFRDASLAQEAIQVADPDSQPHYPLVVPGTVSATWALLGYESQAAAATVSAAWFAAALILVGLSLSGPRRHSTGLAAVALLLSTPALLKWVPSQCADWAVAYALLLGGVAAAARSESPGWPRDRLPPGLFGWSVGLLANIKNEGSVAAAGLVLGWLVAALARRRTTVTSRFRAELATLLPFLAILLGQRWVLAQAVEKPRFFAGSWILRLTDPERWSGLVAGVTTRFDFLRGDIGWSFFWPLVTLAFFATFAAPRDRFARVPAISGSTVLWALGALALVVSSYDIHYVVDTALDRLLVQVAPLALVLALAPWSGTESRVSRGASIWVATARRAGGLARAYPIRSTVGLLLVLLSAKLAMCSASSGAMWRWPEELVVATTSFDAFAPVVRGVVRDLSAPNLVSALLAPVDLLGLEGAARYSALLTGLNLALALVLSIAIAASCRESRPALGWALLGAMSLAGWALLGDTLSGAAFLFLLAAYERALNRPESARAWSLVAAAGALATATDPTLAAPLVAGLAVGLALTGAPHSPAARLGAAATLATPPLLAWLGSGERSFARGAGAYLDLGIDAPLVLLDAHGSKILPDWTATFLHELGYFHLGTLGWFFGGLLVLCLSKGVRSADRTRLTLAGVLFVALGTRAALASAGMLLARAAPPDPRHIVYGRALDFALPAGLWIGARALARIRLQRSIRAAATVTLVAGGGAALFWASLPEGYAERSVLHQVLPFQTALASFVRLSRLGSWAPLGLALSLALVAGLATARLGSRWRATARAAAAGLAALLLSGTGLAAFGEVSMESGGSLRYHSSASRVVRDARNEGRLAAVDVDVQVLGFRAQSTAEILRWKDSLRVLSDMPQVALSASAPLGVCAAVLTPSRLSDRELIATFYEGTLFLWGSRPGPGCELEVAAPRP